jgi:hypothetical protein
LRLVGLKRVLSGIRRVTAIIRTEDRMGRLRGTVLGIAMGVLPAIAMAQTITFDDVNTSPPTPTGLCPVPQLPNGYDGFSWNNFYVLDGSSTYCMVPGGFRFGVVSGPNVAFNGFGDPASVSSSTPFTLDSLFMTAAWTNGLNVLVQGFVGANPFYSQSFVLNTYTPTRFVFNWTGVDSVSFASSGGVDAGYIGHGEQIAFDNMSMTVNVTPEPATLLLIGTGLAGIGGAVRRRRRRNIEH